MTRVISILVLATALTGCTTTHNFDVALKNNTERPLTVGFVKSGPPFEPHWAAPEDFAMLPPSRQPARWGQVVEAGKIASIRVSGKFARGAGAFLRVYLGAHPADRLLAISSGTGNRLDLALHPGGDNQFVIVLDDRGFLRGKAGRLAKP